MCVREFKHVSIWVSKKLAYKQKLRNRRLNFEKASEHASNILCQRILTAFFGIFVYIQQISLFMSPILIKICFRICFDTS